MTENKEININYYKKDILTSLLFQAVIEESFSQPLQNRLRQLMNYWNCTNHKNVLKSLDSSDYDFFGISMPLELLTPDEKKEVQLKLEKIITNTYPELIDKFNKITDGEIKDMKGSQIQDVLLSHQQEKILDLCTKCYDSFDELKQINMEMCALMKDWIDLRLELGSNILIHKAEICNYRNSVIELEAKILNTQLKRFVYNGKIHDYIEYYVKMKNILEKYQSQILDYKKFLKNRLD